MLRMRKKPPSDRPNINSGQAWSAMDMEGLLDLHETGEPAWEDSDRVDEPPGAGKRNPDAAPEILGGS